MQYMECAPLALMSGLIDVFHHHWMQTSVQLLACYDHDPQICVQYSSAGAQHKHLPHRLDKLCFYQARDCKVAAGAQKSVLCVVFGRRSSYLQQTTLPCFLQGAVEQ